MSKNEELDLLQSAELKEAFDEFDKVAKQYKYSDNRAASKNMDMREICQNQGWICDLVIFGIQIAFAVEARNSLQKFLKFVENE